MENRSMLARNSFASICVIPEQTFDWSPLFHINLPLSATLPGEGSKLRKKFDVEYDKPKTSFINRKIEKKAIIPDNNFHSTWIFTWTLQIPGIMRKKSAPDQLNSEKIEHWNMAKSAPFSVKFMTVNGLQLVCFRCRWKYQFALALKRFWVLCKCQSIAVVIVTTYLSPSFNGPNNEIMDF